jgi:plastocyanin
MRPLLVAVVVLVLGSGSAQAADQTVTATPSDTFSPASVTVYQGEKVTWTNGGGTHNVKFDVLAVDLPLTPSATWTTPVEHVFTEAPATYAYHCELHAPGMSGTVTVLASPGQPPPGSPPTAPPPAPPPGGGGPPEPESFKIKLSAADRTPLAGRRFVLSGTVTPAADGRKVQIQRKLRNGKWRTIATATLKDAGSARSKFSVRLKLSADAVLRARFGGDGSKRLRIDVHR